MKLKLAALILRAIAAGSKLLFVLMLGYWGEVELLGKFAIFTTLVIFFGQIAGLEIHQTIGRSLHILGPQEKRSIIKIQSYAVLLSYALLLLIILIFYNELLGGYWILGAFILIGEHITTEIYRYNIIMLKPVKASALLFIKNFGWVGAFAILYVTDLISISMWSILILWSIFIIVAIVLEGRGLIDFLKSLFIQHEENLFLKIFDLIWRGRYFIISAIAIGLIASLDKIFLASFFNFELLGSYYFFQSFATVPALVVGMTIGATIWPKCIQLAACQKIEEYSQLWRKLRLYYAGTLGVMSIIIFSLMPVIMGYMNREYEFSDIKLLAALLLSGIFFVMCEPYKLKLYVIKDDISLMIGNLIQLSLVMSSILLVVSTGSLLLLAYSIVGANFISMVLYWLEFPQKISKHMLLNK
jgi:O-antigen/teichoic acid export membrane protein